MALVLADRVRETSTTSGTGTITLGGAYAGFQSFSVIGTGNTTYYAIIDSVTGAWEVGIGTYTAVGTTLSRDTVLSSSNAGSLVNFAANSKDVIITQPSERAVYVVGSNVVAENSATIPNSLLANSSITVNGSSIALGASATVTANTTNALTIGTGLSGTSFNGSAPVTIAIDSTVATLDGSQTLTNKTISVDNNTVSGIAASSFVLSNASGNIDGAAAQKVIPTGTVVGTTDTQSLTNKDIQARVVVIANATSITINADTTDIATQANTQAAGTLTINAPTGTPYNGQKLMLRLLSTNVQTFSWNAIFQGSTDVSLPSSSTGSSKYDYMGFIYNSTAAKWQLVAKNFGF